MFDMPNKNHQGHHPFPFNSTSADERGEDDALDDESKAHTLLSYAKDVPMQLHKRVNNSLEWEELLVWLLVMEGKEHHMDNGAPVE